MVADSYGSWILKPNVNSQKEVVKDSSIVINLSYDKSNKNSQTSDTDLERKFFNDLVLGNMNAEEAKRDYLNSSDFAMFDNFHPSQVYNML